MRNADQDFAPLPFGPGNLRRVDLRREIREATEEVDLGAIDRLVDDWYESAPVLSVPLLPGGWKRA